MDAGFGSAAEKSLERIHQAWRSSLKGVQTYGLALQELDSDAKACGLDPMALANAVRSGVKDNTPLNIHTDGLQLFNIFVDVATLNASDRCTSMASLRVSAFVDPSYHYFGRFSLCSNPMPRLFRQCGHR
jgi:hypothetical protein